jgi:hypothetical protein
VRQRAVARSCARVGPPPFLSTNVRRCWPGARVLRSCARIATSVRDSRATVHGGSERFHAVGEAGFLPASLLLAPASLLAIRVVSGGGGIRTPEGPNGPLRFSRPHAFGSTIRSEAGCATQRATVGVGDVPSVSGVAIGTSHGTGRDRDQSGRRRRRRGRSCHKPKLPAAKRGVGSVTTACAGLRVGRRGGGRRCHSWTPGHPPTFANTAAYPKP